MSEWRLIEDKPTQPMMGILYSVTRLWADERLQVYGQDGGPMFPEQPWRDLRAELAYWDGKCWREPHSGHRIWDFYHEDGDTDLPTHWMPLLAPLTQATGE